MAQVVITINHREYPISCEDGTEVHIMKLGRMLDDKAHSLIAALGQVNESLLLAMIGLILADELTDLKKNAVSQPNNEETQSSGITSSDIDIIDDKLAQNINSLSDLLKSVANKLKSV